MIGFAVNIWTDTKTNTVRIEPLNGGDRFPAFDEIRILPSGSIIGVMNADAIDPLTKLPVGAWNFGAIKNVRYKEHDTRQIVFDKVEHDTNEHDRFDYE